MSESECFHYRQNWWISRNKSGNTGGLLRKRSDFNQALSTLNRLHREAGGPQTQALLEVQTMEIVVKFFLHLVAMERILLGGLPKNSKKINKRGLRSNGATRCLQIFGKNLRRMAFTNSFYFVYR